MATTSTTASAPPRLRLRLPEAVSALAHRDFRVVWIGQAVSMCGTWMQVVAQGLVVLSLWNSAFALGAVNFANALPSLVVMLFGGVLADRMEKRRILLVTQIVMALAAVVVGVLIFADGLQFWMIIVATAVIGVAFGYDMPAYQAFLPELVPPEKIQQVVALNSSTFHGSRIVGPALAGLVVATLGIAAAYFINAASFLAVIFGLMIIRYRPAARREDAGPHPSAIEGLREGVRHARGRPNLRALMALSALNTGFVFPSLAILMPFYARDVLDAGAGVLGLLMASSGTGSVAGALVLIFWPKQARDARIWATAVLAPAGLIVMSLSREPALSIAACAVVSLAFSTQYSLVGTIIQESTPNEFRGRVMSLQGLTFNGVIPVAALVSSGLAVALGLPFVMALSALLYFVGTVWVLRFAAGGISNVVAQARLEYEAVAAGGG